MNRRTDRETDGQCDFLYIPNFLFAGRGVGKIIYHSCHPRPLVITDNSSYLTYRISLQNSANIYYYNFK